MKQNNKEINAAIIIIGNEILSGRTADTNTSTLAIWLNSIGVKVSEVRIIADVEKIIIETVNLLRQKYNYVFTTGGIGPTHDDLRYWKPTINQVNLMRVDKEWYGCQRMQI